MTGIGPYVFAGQNLVFADQSGREVMLLGFCVSRGDGLTGTELTAAGEQEIPWRGLIAWTAAVVVSLVVLGMLATTFF